jgi:hypothetical protein
MERDVATLQANSVPGVISAANKPQAEAITPDGRRDGRFEREDRDCIGG